MKDGDASDVLPDGELDREGPYSGRFAGARDMRILIADDHPLYREALHARVGRLIPGADILEVGSFEEAVGAQDVAPFDLILMDYHMPGMSCQTLEALVARAPKTFVAVVSGIANASDVRKILAAGARGFIPKTASASHLMHAIQIVMAGGTSVPADYLVEDEFSVITATVESPWLALITRRELEILQCLVRGLSNKEIGRVLGLAEVTVKLHFRSIFRKLSARSRAEAAVIASRANIA